MVGTPLMREIAGLDKWAIRDQARTVFDAAPGKKLVVVCGGSLGSRRLTDTALSLAREWRDRDDVRLVVKAGPEHFATASAAVEGLGNVLVLPYLDRMDLVYARRRRLCRESRRDHRRRDIRTWACPASSCLTHTRSVTISDTMREPSWLAAAPECWGRGSDHGNPGERNRRPCRRRHWACDGRQPIPLRD